MIASIANVPRSEQEMNVWSLAHADLCYRVAQHLNQTGGSIVIQQLDPVPTFDFKNWLARVQNMHNAINVPLGTRGDDLTDLNPQDEKQLQAWTWLVFTECKQWVDKTGIA